MNNKLASIEQILEIRPIRGEQFGQGIQSFNNNPHSKLNIDWNCFSIWLIDEHRYSYKGEKYYFIDVCKEIGLPYVPLLEENVNLTSELIKKYDEELKIINNQSFEGIVINGSNFTFKVINKEYDSKK